MKHLKDASGPPGINTLCRRYNQAVADGEMRLLMVGLARVDHGILLKGRTWKGVGLADTVGHCGCKIYSQMSRTSDAGDRRDAKERVGLEKLAISMARSPLPERTAVRMLRAPSRDNSAPLKTGATDEIDIFRNKVSSRSSDGSQYISAIPYSHR